MRCRHQRSLLRHHSRALHPVTPRCPADGRRRDPHSCRGSASLHRCSRNRPRLARRLHRSNLKASRLLPYCETANPNRDCGRSSMRSAKLRRQKSPVDCRVSWRPSFGVTKARPLSKETGALSFVGENDARLAPAVAPSKTRSRLRRAFAQRGGNVACCADAAWRKSERRAADSHLRSVSAASPTPRD